MLNHSGIWSRALFIGGMALAMLAAPASVEAKKSYRILYSFKLDGLDAQHPLAGVLTDNANNVYGTTVNGGANDFGAVFKLAHDGTETVLYSFTGHNDGGAPSAGLIADASSNLYGTTQFGGQGCGTGCGAVFKLSPDGSITVLHNFKGKGDGHKPMGRLVGDAAGNLYGTTFAGGTGCSHKGCGTVYKIGADGSESVLYAFKGGNDGAQPQSGLIIDDAGNLYGTTLNTIFKVAPDGTETVLHLFQRGKSDGYDAIGDLISDGAGNLYGTTTVGGGTGCGGVGCGTVFKLAQNGIESLLYTFKGGSDGSEPWAGLVADKAGNLYGTTLSGGSDGCSNRLGCGTIFKITPEGNETILHAFSETKDGFNPQCDLVFDNKGNLIGTTSNGGARKLIGGAVFKIAPQ